VKSGGFDAMAASLQTAAELHRTLYSDATRRERAEALIKSSWEKLPLDVRAGLLRRLAENALAAGDAAGATRQLDEAQALVDNNRWLSEDHIAQIAQIARLRAAAGERERAQRDLAGVLGLYERERDKITDIYRADALRPVAEALVALGDRQAALATFARAVDEGLANPNSRPRADDLAETACSIARSKLVPDAELTARLRKAQAGLGDPW
jgi:tetratricopeptide (TPR) repeat protein